VPMTPKKSYWCTSNNKDVVLADCARCRLLCIHNPNIQPVWLWDGRFVQRWGVDEIERFLQEARDGCASPSESGIAASDPGTIEKPTAL
jgi:hypothetical protein